MLVDLLHLTRSLRRSPSSTAAAVLTLSLVLGISAAIAAVIHAALFTPPPVRNPDALVTIAEAPIDDTAPARRAVGVSTFHDWRARSAGLATLEAFDETNLTLTDLGAAERVSATEATPGFLALLGITPAVGRAFEPQDAGQRVVIVSHRFWRGRLGADPDVIGRRVILGAEPHTVIGVLPEDFVFELNPSDFWRPLLLPGGQPADATRVLVLARLRGDVPPARLSAALDEVSGAGRPPMRVEVKPLQEAISGEAAGMVTLLGAAALIAVLMAFANLAGLLVVRSIDRRRELAIRAALGASRWEVARQLLLEAQALVVVGIVGGVFVALWSTPSAGRLALQQFGGLADRDVVATWQVLTAMAGAALACAWVCALLPAFAAARVPGSIVRLGVTAAPRERAVRRLIVTAEVSLAFVLLASLALLGRSLLEVLRADPGFDARQVWALQVSLPAARYRMPADVVTFYSTLQAVLSDRFGRGAASIVDEIPLTGDGGRALVTSGASVREAVLRAAAPGYFDVMRIPVIAGRVFSARDDAGSPRRAVVSAALARSLFGSDPAPGRQVRLTEEGVPWEVVGVVGDVAHRALNLPPVPTVYLPALQAPSHSAIVVLRTSAPGMDPVAQVRDAVARLDPAVPVYRARSMEAVLAASPGVPARRVLAASFGAFAMLAILLAATGLFGVVSHDAAARRKELAVRAALGAGPVRIAGIVAAQTAWMLAAGLAVGSGLAMWVGGALADAGLTAGAVDRGAFGAAALALTAAGLAGILPAVARALRLHGLSALQPD